MKLKEKVHQSCLELCASRLKTLKKAMKAQQEALEAESKSSAGDKYETSRAMAHLEQEKLAAQIEENIKQTRLLESIGSSMNKSKVSSGAFVRTDKGSFYVASGLGRIEVDGIEIIAISPQAPLTQSMLGLEKGAMFTFNGIRRTILELE